MLNNIIFRTMKRFFITTALTLLWGGVMMAQSPTPQRDTIVGREVTYHYIPQWVDFHDTVFPDYINPAASFIVSYNYPGAFAADERYEYAELHVTDTPLNIIGLAVCAGFYPYEWQFNPVSDTDWTHARDFLGLYEHVGDSMRLLACEEFNLVDTARWMECGYDGIVPGRIATLPVYERYFEKPVTVRDSFYVSCTIRTIGLVNQTGLRDNYTIYYANYVWDGTYEYGCGIRVAERGAEDSQYPDWLFYKLMQDGYSGSPLFLFAIFDTTGMGLTPHCDSVQGLHQASAWDNNTLLLWDSVPGQVSWQLAVGLANEDPEGYRTHTVFTPSKALYNLEYNTTYAVRVRGKCEGRENFSAWSDTIQFTLSDRQGIGSAVDRYTYLYPNPASDRVAVFSSFGLSRVELYDLNGRMMYGQDCKGHSAMIDVSGWPDGTYIAIVRTQAGATSQKVTIRKN